MHYASLYSHNTFLTVLKRIRILRSAIHHFYRLVLSYILINYLLITFKNSLWEQRQTVRGLIKHSVSVTASARDVPNTHVHAVHYIKQYRQFTRVCILLLYVVHLLLSSSLFTFTNNSNFLSSYVRLNTLRCVATTSWVTKKQDTKLLSVSSPNIDRFSEFVHWYTLGETCNKKLLTFSEYLIPRSHSYCLSLPLCLGWYDGGR